MSFDPSLVRRALDHLLDAYPELKVKHISRPGGVGPWTLITLGKPRTTGREQTWTNEAEFAIFRRTGALHTMKDGAVSDDPIWTP